jgi:hypothetical protein
LAENLFVSGSGARHFRKSDPDPATVGLSACRPTQSFTVARSPPTTAEFPFFGSAGLINILFRNGIQKKLNHCLKHIEILKFKTFKSVFAVHSYWQSLKIIDLRTLI